MEKRKKELAAIVFLVYVTLWLITNNVVFFIIGITTFAVHQRAE